MKKRNNIIIAAVAILALSVIIVGVSFQGIGPFSPKGIIEGKVTIGPFCPVAPHSGCPPPPGTYTSRKIILKPKIGGQIYIPLKDTGFFHAEVNVGTYEVNLTNCTYLGCKSSLPIIVKIKPNQIAVVNIDIDTGIR